MELAKISPQQNLISRVKPDEPIRRPGIYKPVIMDILTVASALGVGYVYKQFLAGLADYFLLLAAITAFSVLSVLQVFFTKELGHRFWILILEAAALLSLFYGYDLKILGAGAVIVIAFTFWGEVLGHRELENSIEITFFRAAKPTLKKLTTALVLLFVILYTPQLNGKTVLIPETGFQSFYNWAAGLVTTFYPEINLSSSFKKLTEDVALLELKNSRPFLDLSPADQQSAIRQTAADLTTNLNKNFNTTLNGDEPASDAFYAMLVKLLNNWRGRFGYYFIIGWAVAIFLMFRALGVIFYIVAGLIAFLVYQILLASGFIYIFGETRTHEIIEY